MITARQVKLHTLAAEANLARAQRRWAKLTPEQVAAPCSPSRLPHLRGPRTAPA